MTSYWCKLKYEKGVTEGSKIQLRFEYTLFLLDQL